MRNKLIAVVAALGLAAAVLFAQEAEVVQRGMRMVRGNLNLDSGSIVVTSGTLTVGGATTLTGTTTLTDAGAVGTPTITGGTIGKGTTYVAHRQEFDTPCFVFELADGTDELVTDAAVNGAICGGDLSIFSFRIDGAQASPFIPKGGSLDVDNDGAADEGVDIVAADRSATTGGLVVGTSPAMYTRASITLTSVSGTDNLSFGWRIAGAHVDNIVPETIDTGGMFNINTNAGNLEIQTADDGTDADDEEDQVATWADGATHILEVRVSTAGVFTFYIDGLASTITTATGAAAAGDVLVPFFSLLNDTDADTDAQINWWEVGEVI